MEKYLQLGCATLIVLGGLVLIFAGLFIDPKGVIDTSVLVAYGESLTFAGSLLGIDYHYRYKSK